MNKTRVGILKTQDPATGVRAALELLGLQNLGLRGARVLVKPNLASAVPPEEAAQVTHPQVVAALVRYCKEEGAQRVFVGDEPSWGLGARLCFQTSGMQQAVEREGGEVVYFDEVKRITKRVPQGRLFRSLSLPAIVDEVDLLINAPKVKTSLMTLVTLCIKNLFGLLTFRDRKKFHRGVDLAYALLDIARVVRPHLNLIDGIVASEGMGAHSGTPYPLGVLIASQDMVAADLIGTQVMGFEALEPVTNQLALKDAIGVTDPAHIEVVGAPVAEVRGALARPIFNLVHPAPNVEVIPGGICPGCISRVPRVPPTVEADRRYGVIIGRRVRFPREQDFDEIWCLGDCGLEEGARIARRYPELRARMRKIPGCPPLDWWRQQTAEKEYQEKGWLAEPLNVKESPRRRKAE